MSDLKRVTPSGSEFESKPFEAFVSKVNPTSEQIEIDTPVGIDTVQVAHPLLGPNSWIRALPERGARVLVMSTAGGSLRRAVVGYYSRTAAELIGRSQTGKGIYHALRPGEWELMTPGVAAIRGTVEGKLFLRGGVVTGELDPKSLHSRFRAPTHRRELHQHSETDILDEERFGVVVRNKSAQEKHRWIHAPNSKSPDNPSFAKEYTRVLSRDDKKLCVLMEGDVFDSQGQTIKHTSTGKLDREVREYYNADGDVTYQHEVDLDGSVRLAGTAPQIDIEEGEAVTTVALAKLTATIAQQLSLVAQSSAEVSSETTGRFGGRVSTILGPDPSPLDAAVKGTQLSQTVLLPLLQCLQVFAQAGAAVPLNPIAAQMAALAAALTPLIAAVPATLSTNVKVSQ